MSSQLEGFIRTPSDEGFDESSARRPRSRQRTSNPPQILHCDSEYDSPRRERKSEAKKETVEPQEGPETPQSESRTEGRGRRRPQQPLNMSRTPWMTLDSFSSLVQQLTTVLQAKPVLWLLPLALDLSLPSRLCSVALLLLLCFCTERQCVVQQEPPADRRENTKTKRRVKPRGVSVCETVGFTFRLSRRPPHFGPHSCSLNSIRRAESGYLLDMSLFKSEPFPRLSVQEGSLRASFSPRRGSSSPYNVRMQSSAVH